MSNALKQNSVVKFSLFLSLLKFSLLKIQLFNTSLPGVSFTCFLLPADMEIRLPSRYRLVFTPPSG